MHMRLLGLYSIFLLNIFIKVFQIIEFLGISFKPAGHVFPKVLTYIVYRNFHERKLGKYLLTSLDLIQTSEIPELNDNKRILQH